MYRMQLLGPRELALAASPYSDFDAMRQGRGGRRARLEMPWPSASTRHPAGHPGARPLRRGRAGRSRAACTASRSSSWRCETVDLEVPATAEIVHRGPLPARRPPRRGPVRRVHRLRRSRATRPASRCSRCTAITMRADAIYQAGLTGRARHREPRAQAPADGGEPARRPATDLSGHDRRALPGRGRRRVPVRRRRCASATRTRPRT